MAFFIYTVRMGLRSPIIHNYLFFRRGFHTGNCNSQSLISPQSNLKIEKEDTDEASHSRNEISFLVTFCSRSGLNRWPNDLKTGALPPRQLSWWVKILFAANYLDDSVESNHYRLWSRQQLNLLFYYQTSFLKIIIMKISKK